MKRARERSWGHVIGVDLAATLPAARNSEMRAQPTFRSNASPAGTGSADFPASRTTNDVLIRGKETVRSRSNCAKCTNDPREDSQIYNDNDGCDKTSDNIQAAQKIHAKSSYRTIRSLIIPAAFVTVILLTLRRCSSAGDRKNAMNGMFEPPDPEEASPYRSMHPPRRFKSGALCSDGAPCAEIGKSVLERNGSVVDATIATMICNGVVSMHAMGIGGGFIMTIYKRARRKAYVLNARGHAPLRAHAAMFAGIPVNESSQGPLSVAVPGEIAGYWEAHKKFGRLPWADLFRPTIELCKKGYVMTRDQYDSLTYSGENVFKDSTLRELFADAESNALRKPGSLVRPTRLCRTLEEIAAKTSTALYEGDIGQRLVLDLRKRGGIIAMKDLKNYRPKWETPVEETFSNGIKFYSPGLPASGGILALILNIFDSFRFTAESLATFNSTILTYHRIAETFKFAYAHRTNLGDKDFVDMTEIMKNITSKQYAQRVRQKIDDGKTYNDPYHYGSSISDLHEDHGTAHISILAPEGDAVSVTSTINFYFGSGVVSESTGIVLNNLMDDFSVPGKSNYYELPPSPNNFIASGKQPISSKVPSILVDAKGNVRMVVGAIGGSKITTAVAQVIARVLWMGESVTDAVDAPRLHHQLLPKSLLYEYGVPRGVIDGLRRLGHVTERYRRRNSIVCAIYRLDDVIHASTDRRKVADVCGID